MTDAVLIGAGAIAKEHPSDCHRNGEVSGSVQSESQNGCTLSVDGTEVANVGNANIHFDSHSHKYSDKDGDGSKECHDDASHDVDPKDGKRSSILSVEGKDVYLEDTGVQTDPKSGGNIDMTGDGGNGILRET